MDVIYIILAGIVMLNFLRLCGAQKHPIKSMLINSLSGITALLITATVCGFSGIPFAVNIASTAVAVSLGVPGVIMLVLVLFVI